MPTTLTKKPKQIGNIFACKKDLDYGTECNAYILSCCKDVVLKIYRDYSKQHVENIYDNHKKLSAVGLGVEVFGGVIEFDFDIISKNDFNKDNKYGFLCEKIIVNRYISEHYGYNSRIDYHNDRMLLKKVIDDFCNVDWNDDSDYNVGVNKYGDLVVLDMGIGITSGV